MQNELADCVNLGCGEPMVTTAHLKGIGTEYIIVPLCADCYELVYPAPKEKICQCCGVAPCLPTCVVSYPVQAPKV